MLGYQDFFDMNINYFFGVSFKGSKFGFRLEDFMELEISKKNVSKKNLVENKRIYQYMVM